MRKKAKKSDLRRHEECLARQAERERLEQEAMEGTARKIAEIFKDEPWRLR
jgi:hypothetical protein